MNVSFKIILSIVVFLILNLYAIGQKDSLKSKKYFTKGNYISTGLYLMRTQYGRSFNVILDAEMREKIGGSITHEFSNGIAMTIGSIFTKKFSYHKDSMYDLNKNVWLNDKNRLLVVESTIHFPLYKSKNHGGLYIDIGSSWIDMNGFYTSSNNPITSSVFNKNSEFKISSISTKLGVGGEYKFNYFQLYSTFDIGAGFGKLNNTILNVRTLDLVFGVRLKIPKVFKGLKDRYHWF